MAELLSREKEFIKLNQKLDQMATQANALMEQQPSKPSGAHHQTKIINRTSAVVQQTNIKYPKQTITINPKSDYLNNTKIEPTSHHHKTKGKFDITRRRLIGDGIISEKITTNVTTPKGRDNNTTHRVNRHNGKANSPMKTTTVSRKYTRAGGDMNRAQIKSLKNPINTATFSVRYRNPKFVQSPSLEVLLKDGCSSDMSAVKFQRITTPRLQKSGFTLSDSYTLAKESENTSYAGTTHSSTLIAENPHKIDKCVNTTESLVKFLKSKIVILEESHERLTNEVQQHKEILEKALEHSKKVEQQRDQAYAKQNELTDQLNRVENDLKECQRAAEEQSIQKLEQQKELENVKRDLKLSTQTLQNLERKLHRTTQELNNARSSINVMKDAERELRESNRMDANAKTKLIKNLKKQRADLLNAYKKQLYLIDNLKRQNICMEQVKLLDFTEKEFSKILDWHEFE